MVLITILLIMGFITSVEFASLFGIIMGFKGAFQVASVWRDKTGTVGDDGERRINAMERT